MCYNRPAVERAAKEGLASVPPKSADAASQQAAPQAGASAEVQRAGLSVVPENVDRFAIAQHDDGFTIAEVDRSAIAEQEDASRYCPVCSQRLESRHCKLICPVCGYYMSCADYY
jgi:Zn finger protein HypA/HybF involved in hydrogenase expression